MVEPYWWYILYVRSNKEYRVSEDIKRYAASNECEYELDAFYFESEQYYRNKQAKILGRAYKKRPLMPGYVFVETNMPAKEFLASFTYYINNSADIIRILKYNEYDEIAIPKEERQRFEFLYRGKRCLEHSVVYMIGDKIVVQHGPLVGREGLIKHINRHNRDAIIEFEIFGQSIATKVALEIVSKLEQN